MNSGASAAMKLAKRCEYCRLPQSALPLARFHIEHVIARQHRGGDSPGNLALSCHHCNLHKGPNLSGVDPRMVESAGSSLPARIAGKSTSRPGAFCSLATPRANHRVGTCHELAGSARNPASGRTGPLSEVLLL